MRVVKVPLGERSYSIFIGRDTLGRLGAECQRHHLAPRCAVISDETVARLYAKTALESLKASGFDPVLLTVAPGETAKSLRSVQTCYDQLALPRWPRNACVGALGRAPAPDLAGFVAATYLRGLPFVQVPTTLLAQVDSSVGGKVGVNLRAGKNLVGSFHQPRFVLCDLATLDTLPIREFRAGLSEVVKYGIIYDAALFRKLERSLPQLFNRDESLLTQVIGRCCAIKADVVGQDETETGRRAILNFGHTIGHALEAISGYGRYLHGEAISIGQVAAASLSAAGLGLSAKEVLRIKLLLSRCGLPISLRLPGAQRARLLAAMLLDKKVSQGEVKFVLAKAIGQVEFGQKVSPSALERVLDQLQ